MFQLSLATVSHGAVASIPLILVAPFALLLLLIATMPLTPPRVKHLWEHYYPHIAIGLGLVVAAYYLWRVEGGGTVIGHTAHEYFSFISLIGALYVVAGGIHIKVKGESTPVVNVAFLAVGAVLANFIGTTGASMVMIRPWIRLNKIRISAFHIVFFIFVVSNVGGALTPIGDPPLFLGYLRGVPFFWLLDHVIGQWIVTLVALLVAFYVFDRRSFARMPVRLRHESEAPDTWRFDGMMNVLFLGVIIAAVFLPDYWFLREIVMLGAAVASYRLTPKDVHLENHFSFGPIKEVAFLFIGIFATMMPALNYLEQHGHEFGFERAPAYYFASGGLSAVLDNAPTYVNFLKLAEVSASTGGGGESTPAAEHAAVHQLLADRPELVIAVSLGAVFFGAMTYIGNGPNFMVKSIAESAGVRVPSFFGYIGRYSLPILLPILAVCGWIFLH
ncbi:sodium:proton antiporter [Horticoccus luteus]|uniref:Sodium:proton antiporter n=1 Tax=Horticoccus luteus TaxID=2862869 RepID=A0A8F9TYU6_9BACT|nr:sodium:proton antiporter [Horticoccus luteus]QYM80660.1 sodium:proton antiporter [Horticoccus luteus]